MKPPVGAAATDSPGRELEDEGEGSLEMFFSDADFESLAEESLLVVVFVSVACWLGVVSTEGCCVTQFAASSLSGSSEATVADRSESAPDSICFGGFSSSAGADSAPSPSSPSSSSLAPAAPLPHSLSFSEGGQVEVGVGVQESPSSLASSFPAEAPSAPRGFRWILWWRTRLCFKVKVLSQV